MSAAKTKAQGIIDDNAVEPPATAVFSKSYCPYCRATKSLLSELGAKYYAIELDQVGTYSAAPPKEENYSQLYDGAAIQDALEEMTGQRSVPNIFIDKKHIGGNSDLQAKKAELPNLLKAAKAI
ncbi:Glutaredoxin [Macrophomina phaseolina MS6]|uniref:Glutaredoxin n=1 Tax=Macrophomina phaseolina (strain MS6) TaxID=1126212 RepID=K2RXK0_MACPH|nr:Glutaredoxin [Macrophomina phaseolina MS6]